MKDQLIYITGNARPFADCESIMITLSTNPNVEGAKRSGFDVQVRELPTARELVNRYRGQKGLLVYMDLPQDDVLDVVMRAWVQAFKDEMDALRIQIYSGAVEEIPFMPGNSIFMKVDLKSGKIEEVSRTPVENN